MEKRIAWIYDKDCYDSEKHNSKIFPAAEIDFFEKFPEIPLEQKYDLFVIEGQNTFSKSELEILIYEGEKLNQSYSTPTLILSEVALLYSDLIKEKGFEYFNKYNGDLNSKKLKRKFKSMFEGKKPWYQRLSNSAFKISSQICWNLSSRDS